MHIGMVNAVSCVVSHVWRRFVADDFQRCVKNLVDIVDCALTIRQRQSPPGIVGDGYGIIQPVRVFEDGRASGSFANDEFFKEPGNVADFPAERVDSVQLRTHQLFVREIGDKVERPGSGVFYPGSEVGGFSWMHKIIGERVKKIEERRLSKYKIERLTRNLRTYVRVVNVDGLGED